MIEFRIQTQSPEETSALARAFAAVLRAGDVVLLDGELGAGKTFLTRALAEALGVDPGVISSPTFVIVNEYPSASGVPVMHVDAYRLDVDDPDSLETLGWDRVVAPGTIAIVEWGQRVASLIEAPLASVRIEATGAQERRLAFALPDAWWEREGINLLRDAVERGGEPVMLPDRYDTTCPTTGVPVPADSPTWPFADERARMADLYRWLHGSHGP